VDLFGNGNRGREDQFSARGDRELNGLLVFYSRYRREGISLSLLLGREAGDSCPFFGFSRRVGVRSFRVLDRYVYRNEKSAGIDGRAIARV